MGSYVVTVITPLGTLEPAEGELGQRVDEPFARQVMTNLAKAVDTVRKSVDVARENDDLTPCTLAFQDGVSANLCEALSKILIETDASLRLEFSWSPARPQQARVVDRTELRRPDADLLESAAKALRAIRPRQTVQISGRVVRLEKADEETIGSIGVRGMVGGGERTVLVKLPPSDYFRALHAHEVGENVTVEGALERRGSVSWLRDPVRFFTAGELADLGIVIGEAAVAGDETTPPELPPGDRPPADESA